MLLYKNRLETYLINIIFWLLITISSLRGILVLYFNLSPSFVYPASFFLIICFSFYGLFSLKNQPQIPIFLVKIIYINFFFGVLYVFLELLFWLAFHQIGAVTTTSTFLVFLSPFLISITNRISDKLLLSIICVIGFSLSFSVAEDFIFTLKGAEGIDYVIQRRELLRPGFDALGKVGEFFQAAGYTADHHDSANLLGIVIVYSFNIFLYKRKISSLLVFLVSLICLFFTLSAANITITLFVLFLSVITVIIIKRKFKIIMYSFFWAFVVVLFLIQLSDLTSIFLAKFSADSDKDAMLGFLSTQNLVEASLSFFWGHSTSFSNKIIRSEIGYIKMLFEYGVFHFTTIFCVLFYPIVYIYKFGISDTKFANLFAILFGILSLVHYGSVLRTTSIVLIFYIYGNIFFKKNDSVNRNTEGYIVNI